MREKKEVFDLAGAVVGRFSFNTDLLSDFSLSADDLAEEFGSSSADFLREVVTLSS